MNQLKLRKKYILLLIPAVLVLLCALFFMMPRRPDPLKLLAKTSDPKEQALCLTARLASHPEDSASWEQLLSYYQLQGADALTLQAAAAKAASQTGLDFSRFTVPHGQAALSVPLDANPGGIAHGSATLRAYPKAEALAQAGEVVYLSRADGLYAAYHGLEIRLNGAVADNLIPAESGLYFLDTTEKKVKYLSEDGCFILPVSSVSARSFVFLDDSLYLSGTDGMLYQIKKMLTGKPETVMLDTPAQLSGLCVAEGRLYAAWQDPATTLPVGILLLEADGSFSAILPSSASSLVTDGQDALYYLNEQGFPCRLSLTDRTASILAEKKALLLGAGHKGIYYLTEKGRIRRLPKT